MPFNRHKKNNLKKVCVPTQTRYPKHTYFLLGLYMPLLCLYREHPIMSGRALYQLYSDVGGTWVPMTPIQSKKDN